MLVLVALALPLRAGELVLAEKGENGIFHCRVG